MLAAYGKRVPAPGAAVATAPPLLAEVRVEDLHKAFGSHQVLRGVSLEVRRGEMVAIVGGSGCGKTVLLRHLIGHFRPDRGRVWVADHESAGAPLVDLATLDEAGMDRLRRHWGVVFQGNGLFTGSVYDNVALALREVHGLEEPAVERRVRAAVAAVGLDPSNDLALDRAELSGGMAKRVGIARALALDPLLMFYDEPTAGLDPHSGAQVQALIAAAHAAVPASDAVATAGTTAVAHAASVRRTSVLITHDGVLLQRLRPRVVMLLDGRIAFDGPYQSFTRSHQPEARDYLVREPPRPRDSRNSSTSESASR